MADADLVQSFNSGIQPGLHIPYTQVHVLLIHWDVNDLQGVEEEVQRLRDVFQAKYNYNSVIFRIPTDKSCRIRLNKEILGFVENQSQRDGLIIVYYAGHCGPGDHGQAEWAAFEDQKQPKLSWNEGQQLLFSAPGDVLLILDCCNASLIALGSKDEGSRFELIAASAKDGRTPVPGTKSFTTTLTKLLKLHADEGISSENLSSELREHRKITETPVFHNFVRKSPTSIRLQRLNEENRFMEKPSSYLWFRVSLSGDVTGTQIAEWLKSAPPKHATAVRIEAIVSRARRIQEAFPKGSVFQELSQAAREEIERRMRGLDTVMAAAAQYAKESTTIPASEKADAIHRSFDEIEETVSTVCTAIETPLLLEDTATRDPNSPQDMAADGKTPPLLAAADVGAALDLRQAILNEEACLYTVEISYKTIMFKTAKSRGGTSNHSRFKYGTLAGQPVIMETYEYKEAKDFSGQPQPQTLHQARRITGLLRHPKRTGFHILPCAGFFWNRGTRNEMGLVFNLPPTFEYGDGSGVETLLELYKMHKLVPLGHRIHLAWAMTAAIEHFHRVGWVHKSIRSNNIAFAAMPKISLTRESSDGEDENSSSPNLGDFDLSNPLLFGFEYSRAGDAATYLEEDHSRANNLYRVPERWNKPAARFKKSHDVYSLGVVLFEIALWKDVESALKSFKYDPNEIAPSKVTQVLKDKCVKSLPHQVGAVFARCILTCLDFEARTKGLSEYETQRYFQKNIVEPMGRAVRRI
ncbi:hypothetical protein CDV36_003721 [Fusarium kuroshium]|uniref:Protein kinase domain-containing protein n=2 Tax=Fusarium solani species complex TaxID=232080 RepID=A0A3M2SGB7_9HYPO|nr:hypothetical protein CDV36_003721 [Fusarium kuroshium]RSM12578.1 hypothetical protein CEP52_002348 [Fusarium oligoseptatum]